MDGLRLVLRAEVRRRWPALLGLAALVAVVVGMTAAGVAGARRSATVLDRFLTATNATDLRVDASSPSLSTDTGAGIDLARSLGTVRGVRRAGVAAGFPVEVGSDDYFMVYSSPDGSLFRDLDRPRLQEGRWPADDAADEIVVNTHAARLLDLGVGDEISGSTLPPSGVDSLFSDDGGFAGFTGPEVTLRVVGVALRGAELSPRPTSAGPEAVASPAFASTHGDRIASYVTTVGIDGDPSARDALTAAAYGQIGSTGFADVITTDDAWADDTRNAHRALALTILGFTAATALAGAFVAGQAIGRAVDAAASDDPVLAGLGLPRRQRTTLAALPTVGAMVAGTVVGLVGSVAASDRFPIGIARRAEVDPGVRLDPLVLALVGGLAVLVGGAAAARAAWLATRPARRSTRVRSGVLTATAAAATPATNVGLRLVAERGGSRVRLPVRSAVAGAIVAVATVTAILVVLASADAVADHPERYGWAWSTMPDLLAEDADAASAAAMDVDGVIGAAGLACTTVTIDGRPIGACALDVLGGSVAFTQVDGRPPAGPDEIAVAPGTAGDLGVGIGDEVTVEGAERPLQVVGTVLSPPIDGAEPDRGVTLAPSALEALAPGALDGYGVIRLAPDADTARVERELEALGFRFPASSRPSAPGEVQQVRATRGLLLGLVGVLGALGALGLFHFLAVSVTRRAADLAVFRALGFTRRDVHHTVRTQALATCVIGLAIGLPVGVVLGRSVWRAAVSSIGVLDGATIPVAAGIAVIGISLVGGVVVAAGPGWWAGRRSPATVLRSA